MNARRWIVGIVGLLLVLLAVWQILAASQGLETIRIGSMQPPLTVVAPQGALGGDGESRPLILIGHGIAGSAVIMRGFADTLAHAGYTVVLWDFDGHGANPRPMPRGTRDGLIGNVEAALAEAIRRGWSDGQRVAIVGHSMGSGVALAYGQKHPDTAATIAVSPTGQSVTPELPRNLLLLAGSLEGGFVRNAEQRLAEAGGEGGDAALRPGSERAAQDGAAGTSRKLQIVPGVEHISILFSPTAHAAVREWLDDTFGPQPGARDHTDRRVAWYGLGVLGTLLAASALVPRTGRSNALRLASAACVGPGSTALDRRRPLWWRLSALTLGAVGATRLLWLAGRAGLILSPLMGLVVGGYVIIWFGVAGVLSLLLLWSLPSRPARGSLLAGLLAFAALWLGVGLLGQLVWLPWLLIPRRLILWPLATVLLLPWFLAVGESLRDAGAAGRAGWWLAHSLLLGGGFFLALQLNPELGFLILILPLFPIILGFHAWVTARQKGAWSFALSGALFIGWLLLAVFPLQ